MLVLRFLIYKYKSDSDLVWWIKLILECKTISKDIHRNYTYTLLHTIYDMHSYCNGFHIPLYLFLYEPNVKGYIVCRLIFYYFAFKMYIHTIVHVKKQKSLERNNKVHLSNSFHSQGEEEKISRQSNALKKSTTTKCLNIHKNQG